MRATFNRETLREAVRTACLAIPRGNPAKPILANLKMTIDDRLVTVEATNLEIGVKATTSCSESDASGTLLLPAATLSHLLSTLSDDEITLELTDGKVVICGSRTVHTLLTEKPDDYPSIKIEKQDVSITVLSDALRTAVSRVVFATANSDRNPIFDGVWFDLTGDTATVVCSDKSSMATQQLGAKAASNISDTPVAVIPAESARIIGKAIPSGTDATISVSENHMFVVCGEVSVVTSLVAGRTVDWRKVMPTFNSSSAIYGPAGVLVAAIQQAAICSNKENGAIRAVALQASDGVLSIRSSGTSGDASVDLPIAEDCELSESRYAVKYLLNGLNALDRETVVSFSHTVVKHNVGASSNAMVMTTGDGWKYSFMPLGEYDGG